MWYTYRKVELPFPAWVEEQLPEMVRHLRRICPDAFHPERATLKEYSRFWDLAWNCAEHCRAARIWKKATADGVKDRHALARLDDVEYLRSAPSIAAAARKVAGFLERYLLPSAVALERSAQRIEATGGEMSSRTKSTAASRETRFADDLPRSPKRLAKALRGYAYELENAPFAKAGYLAHRLQIGPLIYDRPIDNTSRRPDWISVGLIFAITMEFRIYTSSTPVLRGREMPLPVTGTNDWGLVAACHNDALGSSYTAKDVADRLNKLLRRNPGLTWAGWAQPPPEYLADEAEDV